MVKDQCFIQYLFLLITFIVYSSGEYDDLRMVHVIFRHGERTPSLNEGAKRYLSDPYLNDTSYFPYGPGGLLNSGKQSMYNLGTFLRRRYNDFLGDVYYPGVTRVRTTETYRTMMSAQLVNAGLWPPSESQQWNKDFLWLPIPYEYVPAKMDSLMISYGCPTFKTEKKRIYDSDKVQTLLKPHQNFFAYLSKHTGKTITKTLDVLFLYNTLVSDVNRNLTLPTWTRGYFPDGEMYDMTLLEYDIASWNDFLKRIHGGPLVREVLNDHETFIHGTESSRNSNPKIKLYSGHESNIASVLKTLGVWFSHIPDFSSAIMFELLMDKSKNEFGIRIVYYTGRSGETKLLTVPGCTDICPVQKLKTLLSNVIPDDVDTLCGMNVESTGIRSSFDITLRVALQLWILYFVSK